MLIFIILLASLFQQTTAAGPCWRDTPCTGPAQPSFPGSWEKYNFSPASRTVSPVKVLREDGSLLQDYAESVNPPQTRLRQSQGPIQLADPVSLLIFDFGKEVGGIVTVTYAVQGSGKVGVSFSEAKNWTGYWSDDSNGAFNTDQNGHADGALFFDVSPTQKTTYTLPDAQMRGGFRYLTLFLNGGPNHNFNISISSITCELSFQPEWPNLRAYGGYFNSNDDLLNNIWYAGAYTLQTNAIPHNTGRVFPIISPGWINNADISLGAPAPTVYVDGSKRDRTVWAGDLAIAVPSILVSTGDVSGVKNTLVVMYNDQRQDGALPFAGPAINIYNSDTYHIATLIGTYDYFWFTGDVQFLTSVWSKYKLALQFILSKVDSTGLLFVTGLDDWARLNQGGYNSEANMLLLHALNTGSKLAISMNDQQLSTSLTTVAEKLQRAAYSKLWDPTIGSFRDNDKADSIHPQDANAMALFFSVANASNADSVSQYLTTNWISIGSLAPELPNNLCGFGQSFEVKGHLVARKATRALDLIRRSWGWYQNHPSGTGSTFIEGYLADGSFGYRSAYGYGSYSYTSHAHGWSTGPVDALISYIVGLQITQPGGSTWTLAPQFGDLTNAEGGFTTPKGKFSAKWKLIPGGYEIEWTFPGDTVGTIVLPADDEPRISGAFSASPETRWTQAGGYDKDSKTFTVSEWKSSGEQASVKVLWGN
ncbi:glycoside hydrolase family 78 protein [Bisporella sp. PMI_857]|nr:glycoside hydrolase family 78 protein [Bisporella sp. PMI_857]